MWLVAEVAILLANIATLALVLKLYTEFFKQIAQMERKQDCHDDHSLQAMCK